MIKCAVIVLAVALALALLWSPPVNTLIGLKPFGNSRDANMSNSAFVFIKPHAVGDATRQLVLDTFAAQNINVLTEGTITGPEIDENHFIDQHYYAIASKATLQKPNVLPVPEDRFAEKFGIGWQDALDAGIVFNALDACQHLGIDADELNRIWADAKNNGNIIKFGGGFYCAYLSTLDNPIYAFNGFFMQMRSKFVKPEAQINYFVVEWNPADLSWSDFRGRVLGPTDPAEAPVDSIRGLVLAQWEVLGLKSEPNTGDNGVHASASPFEALCERMNWLQIPLEEDEFGQRLLAEGIPVATLREWSVDPQVSWNGQTASVFDTLEDMDVDVCLSKMVEMYQGLQ